MSGKSKEPPVREWPQIRMLRAIALAHEAFREAHKAVLATRGLNLAEFDVIAALGNTDGLRMKDIATHMMTSSSASNVTRVCIALEKRGLVSRRRSPDSDREVLAQLTPKGQALFDDAFPVISTFTRSFADTGLPVADQERVLELLFRFIENARTPPVTAG